MSERTPFALVVLDGWGHRTEIAANAIAQANTPTWDRLWSTRPHTLVSGSGTDVGLPEGQMGNSEVGHMTLGAGRIVWQDYTRIESAIEDGSFATNAVLTESCNQLAANNGALHLFGLVSAGGVHSHVDQICAAIDAACAAGAPRIYVHAFLDGRDVPPKSAAEPLEQIVYALGNQGRIATLCGRYYAMDRDQHWDRVEHAWTAIVDGCSEHSAPNAAAGLAAAYARDESDEFVLPTLIVPPDKTVVTVADADAIWFMNFRADRARELTAAFVDPEFKGFSRKRVPKLARFVMLTEYSADLAASAATAFPPTKLTNTLGEAAESHGLTQLRIAETEKYAHVTFFFSGGREAPFLGESRELIPSPNVATYDLQPEMSAPELTRRLTTAIHSGQHDLIICNYANGDMVGHTGMMDAALEAVVCVDGCLAEIVAAVEAAGAQCLITADHGNVEQMDDPQTGQPHTAHTSEPVPLIYVGDQALSLEVGKLSDIAPTILDLMELPVPAEMTGHSLALRIRAAAS
jgi:2,3-bisphosphoglycerate-independent phosphoglycerate mutase